MSQPAHAATHPEHEAHAARAPVIAPEADIAIDAARPTPQKPEGSEAALVPMEPKLPAPKPQSADVAVVPVATNDDAPEVDMRVRAEQALAAFVKESVPQEFQKGLQLDVLPVVGYGSTGIKLCFHGPNVTTNAPMLNEALIGKNDGALTKHAVLGKFFHDGAQRPIIEAPTDGSNMYHIIFPMSVKDYQNTLKELAGEPVQAAPVAVTAQAVAPIKEHIVQDAVAPQTTSQSTIAALDATPDAQPLAQIAAPAAAHGMGLPEHVAAHEENKETQL